jgi:hypothetical protein
MAVHTELSPTEAADRLALRELFDAYAHCADRRDAEGQKALFTDDTVFVVHMDGEGSEPTYVLRRARSAHPGLRRPQPLRGDDALQRPEHGHDRRDRADGESYTIAHHVSPKTADRKIMIASLRYLDTFAKIDQAWYFAERKLILDWSETRSLGYGRGELMAQQLSFARTSGRSSGIATSSRCSSPSTWLRTRTCARTRGDLRDARRRSDAVRRRVGRPEREAVPIVARHGRTP